MLLQTGRLKGPGKNKLELELAQKYFLAVLVMVAPEELRSLAMN